MFVLLLRLSGQGCLFNFLREETRGDGSMLQGQERMAGRTRGSGGGSSTGKDVQSKVLGSVVPLTGGFLNRADRGTGTHHPLTFPSPMSDEEKTYSSWRAIPTAW